MYCNLENSKLIGVVFIEKKFVWLVYINLKTILDECLIDIYTKSIPLKFTIPNEITKHQWIAIAQWMCTIWIRKSTVTWQYIFLFNVNIHFKLIPYSLLSYFQNPWYLYFKTPRAPTYLIVFSLCCLIKFTFMYIFYCTDN